jgi:hypothetical protein
MNSFEIFLLVVRSFTRLCLCDKFGSLIELKRMWLRLQYLFLIKEPTPSLLWTWRNFLDFNRNILDRTRLITRKSADILDWILLPLFQLFILFFLVSKLLVPANDVFSVQLRFRQLFLRCFIYRGNPFFLLFPTSTAPMFAKFDAAFQCVFILSL